MTDRARRQAAASTSPAPVAPSAPSPAGSPVALLPSVTVDLGGAATFQVTFTNGSGSWDNNGGRDYTVGLRVSTVSDGVVTGNATPPCQ